MNDNSSKLILEVGKKYTAECVDLNHDGMGVFKVNGFTIFALNSIIGEVALLEIEKVNSNYAQAKILEIKKKSKDRVTPICKQFLECGGCDLMHMKYSKQLEFKENMGKETLRRIGDLQTVDKVCEGIIGTDNDNYHYRNKVQIPFSRIGKKTVCGFYKKKTHFIIPLEECYIQPQTCNEIAKFVKNLANEYGIDGYVENQKTGILKHLLIRKNSFNEYMVILVTRSDKINCLDEVVKKITNRYPEVKSILLNIQEKDTNVILGSKTVVLYGKDELIDELLGYKFKLSHRSFFQINHNQTEKLYLTVKEFASFNKNDIVLDAYCGVGSIGITLSQSVKKVYGIEVVPEAVENAKENAKINGINNITFYTGKVEEVISDLKDINFDVVVVDPPRKGCDQSFIKTIIDNNIKKVVYVSCNVATLARDIKLLSDYYNVKRVKFVDMFPFSADVESVALLERK